MPGASLPSLSAEPRARLHFVDGLRGVAALGVVFFHADAGGHLRQLRQALPLLFDWVIERGELGVQIFFVLSGFVISHAMSTAVVDLRYAGRFLLRRSIRLDPPYWASMALIVLCGALGAWFSGSGATLPSAGDLLLHVLYLPVWFGRPTLNAIYWTLCLEVQFYLVFVLLMAGVTRLRHRLGEAGAFHTFLVPTTAFALAWPLGFGFFQLRGSFFASWFLFLLGVATQRAVARPRELAATLLVTVQLLLLSAVAIVHRDWPCGAGVATAAALLLAGRLGEFGSWLSGRWLGFAGRVSYSLYLTHNPVLGAVFWSGFAVAPRNSWTEAFWLAVAVAACLGFAELFYRAFERPSLRLAQRISASGRP